MTDVLFYTVAFGEYDCSLAKMVVESLRASGFAGDAVVFTDRDWAIPQALCLNVAKEDQRHLLHITAPTYHARTEGQLDYLLMRLVPHQFIDLSKYQFLLHADTDVLFFKNPY